MFDSLFLQKLIFQRTSNTGFGNADNNGGTLKVGFLMTDANDVKNLRVSHNILSTASPKIMEKQKMMFPSILYANIPSPILNSEEMYHSLSDHKVVVQITIRVLVEQCC